jgi:nucleoside permease NupC
LPDFSLIKHDPHNAPLVGDPVAQIIQAQQFVALANTREEADAVTTYVKRMREEIRQMFIAAIANSSKVGMYVTVSAFSELLAENKKFVSLN